MRLLRSLSRVRNVRPTHKLQRRGRLSILEGSAIQVNRPHNAGSNAPASGWRTAVAGQRSAPRWRNRRAPPLLWPLLWLAAAAVLWVCIAPVQAQPATGAISGLRLSSDAPGELAVAWELPTPAPADYRVDWARSDEEFRSYTVDENHRYPPGTASAVRISGLAAGVEYKVRVRARYAGWSGPWSEASLTVSAEPSAAVTVRAQTQTAPGAPTVSAASATATTLTINWNAPIADGGLPISSYELRYIESEASERADEHWTLQRGLAAGATVLTGLTDGVSYDIQARAVNAVGDGPWSATRTAVTTDHGDTRGEATPLGLESSMPGRINRAGDQDVFVIETPRAALLTVSGSGAANIQGSLSTSEGAVLVSSSGSLLNAPRQFSLDATVEAGAYYLTVSHALGGTGSYLLQAELQAETRVASQSRTALDPNDATVIELDSYVDAWMPSSTTNPPNTVLFTFTLDDPTEVWIHSSDSSRLYLDLRAELLTDNDVQLEQNDNSDHLNITRDFMIRRSLDAGTYFLRVTHLYTSVQGTFRVHLRTVTEPGSTAATATALPLRTIKTGRIASATDQDFFQFTIGTRRHVIFYISSFAPYTTLDLTVFKGEEELSLFSVSQEQYGDYYPHIARFARNWLDAGTYTLRITAAEGVTEAAYIVEASTDEYYEAGAIRCAQITILQLAGQTGDVVDPLFGCQWHLKNTKQLGAGPGFDINVEGVWESTKGEGINVAVNDSELQADHPDLQGNINLDLSYNVDPRPNARATYYSPGTAVVGIIAAKANDIGVRGVAPEATILFTGGIIWGRDQEAEDKVVDAMVRNLDVVAVSNNSYGQIGDDNIRRASPAWEAAVTRGVNEGFGDKGILYVFNGGAAKQYADDGNLDLRRNYYAVTAVCGVGYEDHRMFDGNHGANLWICAPATNITSTGYAGRYSIDRFSSGYATAIVSGAAALIRAANSELTWRDVKLILAASARWNHQSSPTWQTGAAKYGTTGKYRFNHDYGFGVVDVGAAVTLANSWTNLPAMTTFEASSQDDRQPIPDAPGPCCHGPTVTSKVTIDPYIEFIEFVELHIEFDHPSFRDVKIELVSPTGAVSTILPAAHSTRINSRFYAHELRSSARFGSARHLGENPAGEWTLRLTDEYHGRSGDLVSWRLKIYGHGDLPGRPSVTSAVAGMRTLTIGWAAPAETGSGAVTTYDLRYIRSSATDKSDDNWTRVIGVGASDSDTYQMANLGPGARYDVQVRALTSNGAGPWSLTYEAHPTLELPWAPTNVDLSPRHLGLGVSWRPPAEDGGADVSRYELRYIRADAMDKADANWTPVAAWNAGGGELRFNIPSLLNGTSYDVQLLAHTSVGNSPWTETVASTPNQQNFAPSIDASETLTRTVHEQYPSGTTIGAPIEIVDADRDVLEFSLADTDNQHFAIDSVTGQLSVKEPLDFEQQPSYTVTLRVTDNKNASDELDPTIDVQAEITISVINVNEAHRLTSQLTYPGRTIEENGDLFIAQFDTVDPEMSPMLWTLEGLDAGDFDIDQNGRLSLRFVPDYEVPTDQNQFNDYNVDVVATDDGSVGQPRSAKLRFYVIVKDVNEPPTISGPENVTFDENASGAVARFSAADPERGALSWSLSGADQDAFEINSGTLTYKLTALPNYEAQSTFQVTVKVTDGVHTASHDLTVMINDLDEPGSLTLSSPQPVETVPYVAVHSDFDNIVSEIWTWDRSADRSSWTTLTSQTSSTYTPVAGDISFFLRATVDYEDGHGSVKQRRVVSAMAVQERPPPNEAPMFAESTYAREVDENSVGGTEVGLTVVATDADGDQLTYSLSGPGSAQFDVIALTGQISVSSGAILNHERDSSLLVTLTASDPYGNSGTTSVTITVNDVNERPVATDDIVMTEEDKPLTIEVLANDTDPDEKLSFRQLTVTIRSGPDNGDAEVQADQRVLYTPRANFNDQDSFSYDVSDGQFIAGATVIITVTPENDAPKFLEDPVKREVPTSASEGTLVGPPLTAADVDGDQPIYSLQGAPEFEIDDTNGQLTIAPGVTLDRSVTDAYSFTVVAKDDKGGLASVVATVSVVEQVSTGGSGGSGGGGGGGGGPPPVAVPSDLDFDWNVTRDIEALHPDNDLPTGIWSDGETLWVLENSAGGADLVFAYELATGERREAREFVLDRRNRFAHGIWSDGEIVWIADSGQDLLFAYRLATGERLQGRDIGLGERNRDPRGIWSDGEALYVLDSVKDAVFVYDVETGELGAQYALDKLNQSPRGIWSDGLTLWISDDGANRIFAYRIENETLNRYEDEEFTFRSLLKAGNGDARGIWSDGDVIYVVDEQDDQVYSYNIPDAIQARLGSLSLSALELGGFRAARLAYPVEAPVGTASTTIVASATQAAATVAIAPADADADADGHQIALDAETTISITVTSADGSRSRTYTIVARRLFCLQGLSAERLSQVRFIGGSIAELAACAGRLGLSAFYHYHDGSWAAHFLDAPEFLNRPFRNRFAAGLPPGTLLIAKRTTAVSATTEPAAAN